MRKPRPKPFDTRISPVGWYSAWILMRFQWDDEDQTRPLRRCLAWENQILIQARAPQEAYRKALAHGRMEQSAGRCWARDDENRTGSWMFVGLSSLVPISDRLEDGAEITWKEFENVTVKRIGGLARAKHELEAFRKRPRR